MTVIFDVIRLCESPKPGWQQNGWQQNPDGFYHSVASHSAA
jgi:hypothetical protein